MLESLRYTLRKEALEKEFLQHFLKSDQSLSGHLRFASFSSYTRSCLIPKLALLKKKHPALHFDIFTRETAELEKLLLRGEVDFIFTEEPPRKKNFVLKEIEQHEYLLVGARHIHPENNFVFLDTSERDTFTADFWKLQDKKPPSYTRVFLDDIYAILEAVKAGFGKALLPIHLLEGSLAELKIEREYKSLFTSVYLVSLKQNSMTRAEELILSLF